MAWKHNTLFRSRRTIDYWHWPIASSEECEPVVNRISSREVYHDRGIECPTFREPIEMELRRCCSGRNFTTDELCKWDGENPRRPHGISGRPKCVEFLRRQTATPSGSSFTSTATSWAFWLMIGSSAIRP